jgi:HEAT repeat protein
MIFTPAALAQQREPLYEAKPLAYWVERLQKADTDRDQAAAARAIQAFGPDAGPAIPVLVEMLDDRSPEFRNMIAGVLCGLGPHAKSAVPELIKQLKEKRAREPRLGMEVLGFIGPDAKDAVPLLAKALDDPVSRDVAVEALCNIGPASKEAIPAIRRIALEAVAGKERNPQATTPQAVPFFLDQLHNLGPDVVPLLMEMLDGYGAEGRAQALKELAKLGPAGAKAAPRVAPLLKHEKPDIRRDAAITLWKVEKNVTAIPVLAALLKEEDANLAMSAVRALGEIGPDARGALPAIKELLGHADMTLQTVAKAAIKKVEAVNETKN